MRQIQIDKSLDYYGQQISYKVSGTVEGVQQLVKEYQPKKVYLLKQVDIKTLTLALILLLAHGFRFIFCSMKNKRCFFVYLKKLDKY